MSTGEALRYFCSGATTELFQVSATPRVAGALAVLASDGTFIRNVNSQAPSTATESESHVLASSLDDVFL